MFIVWRQIDAPVMSFDNDSHQSPAHVSRPSLLPNVVQRHRCAGHNANSTSAANCSVKTAACIAVDCRSDFKAVAFAYDDGFNPDFFSLLGR